MSNLCTFASKLAAWLMIVGGSCYVIGNDLIVYKYDNVTLSYKYRYDELFTRRVSASVVLLGGSDVAHGVVPDLINVNGLAVYNFGFNGAAPSYTSDWYDKWFSRYYSRPKLVIYGVGWQSIVAGMFRRIEDDYEFVPPRAAMDRFRESYDLKFLLLSAGVTSSNRFYRKWNRSIDRHYPIRQFSNGFIPFEDDFHGVGHIDESGRIKENEVIRLTELVGRIVDDGIPLVMVEPPVYLQGVSVEAIERSSRIFRGIADWKAVPFLNFNDELASAINLDKSLYADVTHLDVKGAVSFTRLLNVHLGSLLQQRRLAL